MPEKPASERTEQPTAGRLRKARRDGQVAQSRELPSALMIVALLAVLGLSASWLYRWMIAQVQEGMSLAWSSQTASPELYGHLIRVKAGQGLLALMPFLLAALAVSVLGSVLVGGWAYAPKAMAPRMDRMNPVEGLKRLFSLRSLMTLVISLAKLTALIAVAWLFLKDRLGQVMHLSATDPATTVHAISQLVFSLIVRVAIVLAAVAAVDVLFQKWKYKRDLRMTRQEVKEERKEHELSGEVRGRMRAIQIEMARKRMLQDVPAADVIVVNPTHVAVALKYDSGKMAAPQVVAKGAELLCAKIKEIARAHSVPVLHRPELARALYATVDVGQAVPDTLFVAVAEVLALIYRLRRRRQP